MSYKTKESFVSSQLPTSISFCPGGLNVYYDKHGNTNCCDGNVGGNQCNGTPRCSLSQKSTLPSCTKMLQDIYKIKSKQYCPANAPNYFEDATGNNAGCTASPLVSQLTAPAKKTPNDCIIYKNTTDNNAKEDSCLNKKNMETTQCFGTDCKKTISIQNTNPPVALIGLEFTDIEGHRHSCYTASSYQTYIDIVKPNHPFDVNTNISICEVAKKVFVDKTMNISDTTS